MTDQAREQVRESILSLTNSLLSDVNGESSINLSYADDEVFAISHDDSLFSKSDENMDTSGDSNVENVSKTAMEITSSVSDRAEMFDDDGSDRGKINESLRNAYGTCMRRFERAIGQRMINNDVIKLQPVSTYLSRWLLSSKRKMLFR